MRVNHNNTAASIAFSTTSTMGGRLVNTGLCTACQLLPTTWATVLDIPRMLQMHDAAVPIRPLGRPADPPVVPLAGRSRGRARPVAGLDLGRGDARAHPAADDRPAGVRGVSGALAAWAGIRDRGRMARPASSPTGPETGPTIGDPTRPRGDGPAGPR